MGFSELDALLREVAENPSASSAEADQARGWRNAIMTALLESVFDGKTTIEAREESLKRCVVGFLLATLPSHKGRSRK